MNSLQEAFRNRTWVTSIQLDPFVGGDKSFIAALVAQLVAVGVRFFDINSSSKGVKQDSLHMASGLANKHCTTIPHITPRDSLADAVLSQVLGAYTWAEVRNVLVISGDPREHTTAGEVLPGVWQTDAIALIGALATFRTERNLTDLLIGCAFSQTRQAPDEEMTRFRRKVGAGADFVMTQPVFWHPELERDLDILQFVAEEKPTLVGFWPFFDGTTMEKVRRGDIEGVVLLDGAYAALQQHPVHATEFQAEKIAEMTCALRERGFAGAYIVTPFRKSFYAEFLDFLRLVREAGGVL